MSANFDSQLELLKTNANSFSEHGKSSSRYWLFSATIFVFYVANLDTIFKFLFDGCVRNNYPSWINYFYGTTICKVNTISAIGFNFSVSEFIIAAMFIGAIVNIPFCVSRICTYETFYIQKFVLEKLKSKDNYLPPFQGNQSALPSSDKYDQIKDKLKRIDIFIDSLRFNEFSRASLLSRYSNNGNRTRYNYLKYFMLTYGLFPMFCLIMYTVTFVLIILMGKIGIFLGLITCAVFAIPFIYSVFSSITLARCHNLLTYKDRTNLYIKLQ